MKRDLVDGRTLSYGKAQRTIKVFLTVHSSNQSLGETFLISLSIEQTRNIRHKGRVWRGKHIPDCPLRVSSNHHTCCSYTKKKIKEHVLL